MLWERKHPLLLTLTEPPWSLLSPPLHLWAVGPALACVSSTKAHPRAAWTAALPSAFLGVSTARLEAIQILPLMKRDNFSNFSSRYFYIFIHSKILKARLLYFSRTLRWVETTKYWIRLSALKITAMLSFIWQKKKVIAKLQKRRSPTKF